MLKEAIVEMLSSDGMILICFGGIVLFVSGEGMSAYMVYEVSTSVFIWLIVWIIFDCCFLLFH